MKNNSMLNEILIMTNTSFSAREWLQKKKLKISAGWKKKN